MNSKTIIYRITHAIGLSILYYPATVPAAPVPPADFAQRAGQFTGSYRSTRMASTTIEKM
jgi:hypothetical protein